MSELENCSLCDKMDECNCCDRCDYKVCDKCYEKNGERVLMIGSYINECFVCFSEQCDEYTQKQRDEINGLLDKIKIIKRRRKKNNKKT